MKEVNYNEKALIPFLQKKCQDLLTSNLILEANVSMLSVKVNDLQSEIEELTRKNESLSKRKKKDDPVLDGQSY